MEDLFWESPTQTTTFYDYIYITDLFKSSRDVSGKLPNLEQFFCPSTFNLNSSNLNITKFITGFYNIQEDLPSTQPDQLTNPLIELLVLLTDTAQGDDDYTTNKASATKLQNTTNHPITLTDCKTYATTTLTTFNHFLSTYQPLSPVATIDTNVRVSSARLHLTTNSTLNYINSILLRVGLEFPLYRNKTYVMASSKIDIVDLPSIISKLTRIQIQPKDTLSKPVLNYESPTFSTLNVRSATKDSITNYNAFQKVFRSRLDEGRAHLKDSNLSTTYLKQPLLNDFSVPYSRLLGKNSTFFHQTPINKESVRENYPMLSSLILQTSTQVFAFPFLEALQSDLLRYT